MTIQVDDFTRLELLTNEHVQPLFELAHRNREHLRPWFDWIDKLESEAFIHAYIEGSAERKKSGKEYAFAIMFRNKLAGRIGMYNIDPHNRIGEVGYWLDKDLVGQGLVTRSCAALMDHCFDVFQINRIEIRCAVNNARSRDVPERLKFRREGLLREAGLVRGEFVDLELFSFCRIDRDR